MTASPAQTSRSIKAVILAGGKSSRLGRPKHLLQTPQLTPLYHHQLQLIRSVLPSCQIFISLAQESQQDEMLSSLEVVNRKDASLSNRCGAQDNSIFILMDQSPNGTDVSSGPASGLVAAHAYDPEASWLVVACDYPLVPAEALQKLLHGPDHPVKCFKSSEGFCEPLLGLWSPEALRTLTQRVTERRLSPSAVVKEVGGHMLEVPQGFDCWVANVNTAEEWAQVLQRWDDIGLYEVQISGFDKSN